MTNIRCPHCGAYNFRGAQTDCVSCGLEGCTNCTEERNGRDYHIDCNAWVEPCGHEVTQPNGSCSRCGETRTAIAKGR